MARQRMITRTINVVKYEVICMDVTTVETSIQSFELTGENLPDNKALKMLQTAYETETFKIVAITNKSVAEKKWKGLFSNPRCLGKCLD